MGYSVKSVGGILINTVFVLCFMPQKEVKINQRVLKYFIESNLRYNYKLYY